jgi:hypothetical protein
MRRVDVADLYVRILRDGSSLKRIYGMSVAGSGTAQALPAAISTLIGTYEGIATGGPFGTESAQSIQVSVSAATLDISIKRFFSGTCRYTATIQADGRSLTNPTYQCSDFTTGTWSLVDLRVIGGADLYVALSASGDLRRAYGIR